MDNFKIRTSNPTWPSDLALVYKARKSATVVDDAGLGIDPAHHSLLEMGKRGDLSGRDWLGVLASLGLSGAGLWMVRLAVIDPEPTSKLWLLVAGGSLALITGGGMAIWILTDRRPPVVRASPSGFEIHWA